MYAKDFWGFVPAFVHAIATFFGEFLMLRKITMLATVAALSISMAGHAFAMDEAGAKKFIADTANKWLATPEVTDAIKAHNTETAGFDQAKIDELDKKWKDGDAATIDAVMKSKLSEYLKKIVADSDGLYTEIIIMDAKGLNVGLSDKTSDNWQGDEDKFSKTFTVGADAVHLGEVELDESSQVYSQQLSVTISDGGAPIGAATIGLNADKLPK